MWWILTFPTPSPLPACGFNILPKLPCPRTRLGGWNCLDTDPRLSPRLDPNASRNSTPAAMKLQKPFGIEGLSVAWRPLRSCLGVR